MTTYQTNQTTFTLLNGPAGDSAVHVQFGQTGEKVMFDLGTLEKLTYGELLEISHAFVSHTHFDHFFGFDALLRATFPLERPIEISGPAGITDNVLGKLRGYRWNLVKPGQIRILVREISVDGGVRTSKITNVPDDFVVVPVESVPEQYSDVLNPPLFVEADSPVAFVTNLKENARVFAVCLDHFGTPSVAYQYVTPKTLRMRKERFAELELKPGRWVGEFQKAYLDGKSEPILIDGTQHSMASLVDELLEIKPAFKFVYLTDFGFTPENVSRVLPFIESSTYILIESNYRDTESQMALEKGHLTTRQSAFLAAYSQAEAYQNFHISSTYETEESEVLQEAQTFFQQYRQMSRDELAAEMPNLFFQS